MRRGCAQLAWMVLDLGLTLKCTLKCADQPGYDRLKLVNMLGTLQNCLAQTSGYTQR